MEVFGVSYVYIALGVEVFSFLTRGVILAVYRKLLRTSRQSETKPLKYLVAVLFSGLFTNLTVVVYLLSTLSRDLVSPLTFGILSKLECATLTVQFYALLHFFFSLSSRKRSKVSRVARALYLAFRGITALFIGYYVFRAVHFYFYDDFGLAFGHGEVLRWHSYYLLATAFASIILLYRNYRREKIRLLRSHIASIVNYFVVPYFIVKVFELDFVSLGPNPVAASITSFLLTAMMGHIAFRPLGLRFLNVRPHVQSPLTERSHFVNHFTRALNQLGSINDVVAITPITKDFFSKSFGILDSKVHVLLRSSQQGYPNSMNDHRDIKERGRLISIEKLFSAHEENAEMIFFLKEQRIIIRDEIEFSAFYAPKESVLYKNTIQLMNDLDADIFLPLFDQEHLIASIIVGREARTRFFTDIERDQMIIYARHLESITYFLSHVSVESLRKRLNVVSFRLRQQEVLASTFKDGVFSFLKKKQEYRIGVLVYKNRKFIYLNKAAMDVLSIDLNKDRGEELTKEITQLARQTATFFTPHKALLQMPGGDRIVVSAMPNTEKNGATITVSQPTVYDLVEGKRHLLKEASKWDMLVSLETTSEGSYVNQLLPADTPLLLNMKLLLFEYAMTQRNLLFEMSEEDALSFAHVVHKMNKRKLFKEVVIKRDQDDFARILFGVNPLFAGESAPGLLKTCNKQGTIVLQNVHLLSLDNQKKLLGFIKTGSFAPLKSDKKTESSALLICTSNQDLLTLVQRGAFLSDLYLHLQDGLVNLPSLATLPQSELLAVAEGLRLQVVYNKIYKNILTFTDRDERVVLSSGCVSLHELRQKVKHIVHKKLQRQEIASEKIIDPAYNVSDLELVEAARLGKHALKDPKVLEMLMAKFNYQQSKVAQFLDVNRSTVSRRCLQFNIAKPEPEKRS